MCKRNEQAFLSVRFPWRWKFLFQDVTMCGELLVRQQLTGEILISCTYVTWYEKYWPRWKREMMTMVVTMADKDDDYPLDFVWHEEVKLTPVCFFSTGSRTTVNTWLCLRLCSKRFFRYWNLACTSMMRWYGRKCIEESVAWRQSHILSFFKV